MKIICIGRNYAEHIKELNHERPENPLFFIKPDSAILQRGQPFFYPDFSTEIDYELEVVVRINRLGKNIQPKFAYKYYNEVALGIDFTARDLQRQAINKGNPWTMAKGFDDSAVVSEFVPLSEVGKGIQELNFELRKNDTMVQHGYTGNMIFGIDELIAYISQFMTLKIGDYIFTGTPAGVGSIQLGDVLEGFLENQPMLKCRIK
jgi:2-keto-4-pentenoate hydratase/2-oxohepta-3-ene-1,7-dioic acid hydratase in catechol pathway